MTTIEHIDTPSRRGQRLIQVQLIHSLPFVTTTKKKGDEEKKELDRNLKAVGPGLPRKRKKGTLPKNSRPYLANL